MISLVIDVSKDLYTYYRAVRNCDTDIKELRTQLLSLYRTAGFLTTALRRDGLSAEDKSQVDAALTECEDAAKELKSALDRIRIDNVQPQTALDKMKAAGRKAVYPFKKSTVAGLAEDAESCQDALHVAISILQLNVGATTVEQLTKLDDQLVDSTATLESAMKDLGLAYDTGKDEIVQHLLQNRKMLAEQRKMLTDEENRRKAMTIVETLKYQEMTDRQWQVRTADDSTLGGLFVGKEFRQHPQIMNLLSFLEGSSGLFWIQGKPASGKSTFMKYLLSRSHGPDKLWSCSDPQETLVASHFCWIAGSTMQKSQQGLLQSLLWQVLMADLALVPTACPFRWSSGSNISGGWHEKELWGCLYAAVSASDKQLYFFIDGLDEIQPEEDHMSLAKALNQLSSHRNVKMIVSSRLWAAFERNLEHDGKVMKMEDNNRLAIARYVRAELEKNATDEAFSQVSWDCIHEESVFCESKHDHTKAHDLAYSITTRANGVFLWVFLVMQAVCRHVAMDCPISVLNSYVGKLPTELSGYFQNMIFDRIHESMLSETAMALWIALLDDLHSRLCHYALLCTYTDSGVSWLTDPEFVSELPYTTITPDELFKIIHKTEAFLRLCCRDIFVFPPRRRGVTDWRSFVMTPTIFSHRTVFDYLHTEEMQLLLREHTPDHFKDALFSTKLHVASSKMVVIDPRAPYYSYVVLRHLESCAHRLMYKVRDPRDQNAEWAILQPHRAFKLAQTLEQVSLHFTQAVDKLWTTATSNTRVSTQYSCMSLSVSLATHGFFKFTDTLVDVAPQFLGSSIQMFRFLQQSLSGTTLFQHDKAWNGEHHMAFDVGILRRLLQAGANPNWVNSDPTISGSRVSSTSWRQFLQLLAANTWYFLPQKRQMVLVKPDDGLIGNTDVIATKVAANTWYFLPQKKQLVLVKLDDALIGDTDVIATKEKVFAEQSIQDAIKTFIEFGAELTPEDVEMLTKCLPKPDGNNFDWPEFLSTYSQPAKRVELEEDRAKRLRRWPEGWLDEEDRTFLQISSWRSTRGYYRHRR